MSVWSAVLSAFGLRRDEIFYTDAEWIAVLRMISLTRRGAMLRPNDAARILRIIEAREPKP